MSREEICYSFLLADRIIREDNGKYTVIGIFDRLLALTMPLMLPPFFIYAGIANVIGNHTITINMVHDDTQAVILPMNIEVTIQEGNGMQLAIPAPAIVLPKLGKYSVTMNIDGNQVSSRIIEVVPFPQ